MGRVVLCLLTVAAVSACQTAGVRSDLSPPNDYLQGAATDGPGAMATIPAAYEAADASARVQRHARIRSDGAIEGANADSDGHREANGRTYEVAQAAGGAAADSPASGGQAGGVQLPSQDVSGLSQKLADPTSNVWALFTEIDWNFNQGKATSKVRYSQTMLFQPVLPIPLTENLKLLTRPVVPFETTPLPSGLDIKPTAVPGQQATEGDVDVDVEFDRKTGLGDIQLPLLISPVKGPKFAGGELGLGAGPTFIFPTATSDPLGNDRWQAGTAGVVTWKNKDLLLLLFPQWWWSYAGGSPTTNHGALLYGGFLTLSDGWSIGTNPTATYDARASSGNKMSLPVGLTVAKMTKVGELPVKFQFGAEYFVVNQDDYGPRFQLKLNIIPVIPALIKEPIFG